MLYAFLVTLREGLEAALIIGILLAYLRKISYTAGIRPVMVGTGAAIALSALAGGALGITAGGLAGTTLDLFEGITMLLAASILTYVVFWMRRQARHLAADLQSRVDRAIAAGSSFALGALAFAVVVREGFETALFLVAGGLKAGSLLPYLAAGVGGALLAVLLGYSLYRGTVQLDLRSFFGITGGLLILFAAGLVANGLKELHEAGVVPRLIGHVWDTYRLLPDTGTPGSVLAAILGYDASPSLVQVLAYATYLVLAGAYYFTGLRAPRPARLVAVALAVLAAAGIYATSRGAAGARPVVVVAVEHLFRPAEVRVAPGERIRFVIENRGTVDHEFESDTAQIEEVVIPPGRMRDIVWRAPRQPGRYDFFCNLPGHREAGMVGVILVEPR